LLVHELAAEAFESLSTHERSTVLASVASIWRFSAWFFAFAAA
jgi:hypothetical protein